MPVFDEPLVVDDPPCSACASSDADAEGARLLHQRQQRRLRRRVGHRRKIAGDLVHVDDGAQAGRAGLAPASRPRPGSGAASRRTSVRHRPDARWTRRRRAACRPAPYSSAPASSGSPCSHCSNPGAAIRVFICMASAKRSFAGIERLEVDDADPLRTAGSGSAGSATADRGPSPSLPGVGEQRGQERVLAARADRRRRRPASARWSRSPPARSASASLSSLIGRGRRGERAEDRQRQAGAAARRVDGELGRRLQPLDPRAVLTPVGQPLLPRRPARRRTRRGSCPPAAPRPHRSTAGSPAGAASETSAAGCRGRPWDRWR